MYFEGTGLHNSCGCCFLMWKENFGAMGLKLDTIKSIQEKCMFFLSKDGLLSSVFYLKNKKNIVIGRVGQNHIFLTKLNPNPNLMKDLSMKPKLIF